MKISISNIAWDTSEDENVAKVLDKYDVRYIDVAPGKYFPDPESAADSEILAVKEYWRNRNIQIAGMQALLFGTQGLNVFSDDHSRARMLKRLESVCRIASLIGASKLVFGSPKNRDRMTLSDNEVIDTASSFFRSVGDIARKYDVYICLEPNPECYGANFMTTSDETFSVVRQVNHSNILMQLDTGAMLINGESFDLIDKYISNIGHVHLSEPQLVTLGDTAGVDHDSIAKAIAKHGTERIVTIEMLPSKKEENILAIEKAISLATRHYRNFIR